MIDTTTLQLKAKEYQDRCKTTNRKPTYKGMGKVLGISDRTVSNVVHGYFNGHRYTDKPCATRCIENEDFEIIKGLFGATPESTYFTLKKEG